MTEKQKKNWITTARGSAEPFIPDSQPDSSFRKPMLKCCLIEINFYENKSVLR